MAWHTSPLFALAEEKGWSQRELAKAMGVTEATVSRVRHGRCQPGAAFLIGVERAFPLHDPASWCGGKSLCPTR